MNNIHEKVCEEFRKMNSCIDPKACINFGERERERGQKDGRIVVFYLFIR